RSAFLGNVMCSTFCIVPLVLKPAVYKVRIIAEAYQFSLDQIHQRGLVKVVANYREKNTNLVPWEALRERAHNATDCLSVRWLFKSRVDLGNPLVCVGWIFGSNSENV